MKENDDLTLLTFGDEVKIIFRKEQNTALIGEAVSQLGNGDATILLFEAIQKAADLADNVECF